MLIGTKECASRDSIPHEGMPTGLSQSNDRQITVLLVGGSRLLQEGIIQLLDDSRFAVRNRTDSIDQAIRLVSEQPDLYDLVIVQLFGNSEIQFFERLAHLKQLASDLRVVLLAWPMKDRTFVASSVEAGIDAYIESNISQENFRQSLDLVVSGEQIYPARLSPALEPDGGTVSQRHDAEYRVAASPGPGAHLSGREIEILRHLANGEPNKVIANELDITEATVKVHVKGILRKIGAANRTQAAIWAIHNGLYPNYSADDGKRDRLS